MTGEQRQQWLRANLKQEAPVLKQLFGSESIQELILLRENILKGDNISLKISLIFNSVKGIRICIQRYIKINYIQNNIFPHHVICCEKYSMEAWEGITKDLKLAYSQ